jgi:hypothetical protein
MQQAVQSLSVKDCWRRRQQSGVANRPSCDSCSCNDLGLGVFETGYVVVPQVERGPKSNETTIPNSILN